MKSYEDIISEWDDYNTFPALPPKPKLSVKKLKDKLDKIEDKSDVLEDKKESSNENIIKYNQVKKQIKKSGLDIKDIDSTKKKLKNDIELHRNDVSILTKKMDKISDKLGVIKSELARYSNLKDEINGYEKKLKKEKKLIKKQRLYKGLEQAYGPRGLKLSKVKLIVDTFQARLPEFTERLFTEIGIKFNIKSGDKSLGFEVKRPSRDAFDIRGLSGGEANRMNIALMFMVMFSMPVEKSTNLVILDEVDRNLDAIGRESLVNSLIPILKSKVETLLVISHNSDVSQSQSFDKTWIFEKKKGISKLVR
jgi:DNA repair exonuclease SbcCD ATPase subunit